MVILFAIYIVLGYWSTKYTVFYNKIVFERRIGDLFLQRVMWGTILGWILIPVALFRKFILKK